MIKRLHNRYNKLISSVLPQLLTTVCRNPSSKFFGCCDRSWWHYKIRDFPSLILQQAGYTLYSIDEKKLLAVGLKLKERNFIVDGVVNFWMERTKLRGYAEEYYPYEDGYPPLAFGTLAIAKIVSQRKSNFDENKLKLAFTKSAKKLILRFEDQAGNQQVAGLAALFYIREIFPEIVTSNILNNLVDRTLALQHEEGWFFEYDGADIGYLSVTLDCLYDIYDCSQDQRILKSIENCTKFCAIFLSVSNNGLAALNSRNTDYVVPYGFIRGFFDGPPLTRQHCATVLYAISIRDVFSSVDERYWSHYIGHSVVRAFNFLDNKTVNFLFDAPKLDKPMAFAGAGLYEITLTSLSKVVVSAFKGGVVNYIGHTGNVVTDFGWTIEVNQKKYTSFWFSRDTKVLASDTNIIIKGYMYPVLEFESTPFKHITLRLLSFLFGPMLIKYLKKRMIFSKAKKSIQFTRTVSKQKKGLRISDCIELIHPRKYFSAKPEKASEFSFRHVASAGSFMPVTSIQNSELTFNVTTNKNERFYEMITDIVIGID